MRGIATIVAALLSFMVTIVLGIYLIPYFRKMKIGQVIRKDGPSWHKSKQGTPTMGGILFIGGILIASIVGFVLCIIGSKDTVDGYQATRLFAGLGMALGFGLIGFVDDYIKVKMHRNLGLKTKQKLIIQCFIAVIYLFVLQITGCISTITDLPFIGQVDLKLLYYPIMFLVIIGTVNAVNLTDGVDGLAASVTFVAALGFTVYAARFQQPYISVMAVALAAGCLGFLLWNFYPAKIFMGDTGSMFLGGMIVALAFGIDMPIIIIFVGFIYFIEALSVILQVLSVKLTGKRIFKMSPIHHHFEMIGWSEIKIVAIFSAITAVMSIVGFIAITMMR